ncbi:MAG: quinolinate phosphoribosyl transferase [Candidatus Bathyarchaeia archaeon]
MSSRDIRDILFDGALNRRVTAVLTVTSEGIIAGAERLKKKAEEIGVEIKEIANDGDHVEMGEVVVRFAGSPKQVALAEDTFIALLSKPSGIATAAAKAVALSHGKFRIVSGGWKKMPVEIKDIVREAQAIGKVGVRVTEEPFVYLDKNYIRIFGGITAALRRAEKIKDRLKVVQLKGERKTIAEETKEAVMGGADILMIDTGNPRDITPAVNELNRLNSRRKVKLGFAGGVKLSEIPSFLEEDIDILEIGREIIDAPLLDMRVDVVGTS